eukprot:3291652-Rhodomonas_salina.1
MAGLLLTIMAKVQRGVRGGARAGRGGVGGGLNSPPRVRRRSGGVLNSPPRSARGGGVIHHPGTTPTLSAYATCYDVSTYIIFYATCYAT